MRKLFAVLVVLALVFFAVVVVGPSLPPGNILNSWGQSVRDMIGGMSQGFGGGYRPITPNG